MNRIVNKLREDNARLGIHVAKLTRELRSTVIVNVTHTWTPPGTTTLLPLISDPAVAAAAAKRQTSRQLELNYIAQHLRPAHVPTPSATRINPTPTTLPPRITPPTVESSMVTMTETGASNAPIQI